MTCHRCGGRMLSRAGTRSLGLVCSDCGTPVLQSRQPDQPHPLTISAVLIGVSAFATLIFFLTNWRPQTQQAQAGHQSSQNNRQRAMLRQLTTGSFVRDAQPIEPASRDESEP